MEKGVNNFRNFNSTLKNPDLAQLLTILFQVYLISFLKEKRDKNEAITARFIQRGGFDKYPGIFSKFLTAQEKSINHNRNETMKVINFNNKIQVER